IFFETAAIALIARGDGAYSPRTAARPCIRGRSTRWLQGPDAPLTASRRTLEDGSGSRGEDLMLLRRLAAVVALTALLFSSGCCCHRWCNRPCWRPFCRMSCCETPCCTPCCAPSPCGPCGPCGP